MHRIIEVSNKCQIIHLKLTVEWHFSQLQPKQWVLKILKYYLGVKVTAHYNSVLKIMSLLCNFGDWSRLPLTKEESRRFYRLCRKLSHRNCMLTTVRTQLTNYSDLNRQTWVCSPATDCPPAVFCLPLPSRNSVQLARLLQTRIICISPC